EIRDHGLIEPILQISDPIDVEFESDCPFEVPAKCFAQLAAGSAEVEESSCAVGMATDEIDQNAMAASLEILELIDVRHQYSDHGLPLESVPGAKLRTSTM